MGWHTDGGASLLHAAVTLFGSRAVEFKQEGVDGCISRPQRPGYFYVANFTAMSHRVCHGETATGCFGDRPQVQVVVQLRSDLFRQGRARNKNATPGPSELYYVVNKEVAKHLAQQPLYLPGLAAVIAESREAKWEF